MSAAPHWIDGLKAPLLVSWQITRDCDLCCLHCCTESAPGKRMPGELAADEALALANDIVRQRRPLRDALWRRAAGRSALLRAGRGARAAGRAAQDRNQWAASSIRGVADRLARLPIRSIQVSLDGDSEDVYQRQRPGGSLARAHAACRAAREAGLPLEVTFAPTRLNIHEAEQVIERARSLGAFRFNTGRLMRIGTAARLWDKLEPDAAQYERFLDRPGTATGG